MKITMKKKSRSHLYDTNRPRLSQTHKHTKYKFFSHYNDANTYKQHVPEKVKLEKKNVVYKKACIQSVLIVEFGTAAKLLQ